MPKVQKKEDAYYATERYLKLYYQNVVQVQIGTNMIQPKMIAKYDTRPVESSEANILRKISDFLEVMKVPIDHERYLKGYLDFIRKNKPEKLDFQSPTEQAAFERQQFERQLKEAQDFISMIDTVLKCLTPIQNQIIQLMYLEAPAHRITRIEDLESKLNISKRELYRQKKEAIDIIAKTLYLK